MRVLQVNTLDSEGGAARVATNLMRGLRRQGHQVTMAVGRKSGHDRDVHVLADDDRPAFRAVGYAALQKQLVLKASRSPGRGWGRLSRSVRYACHPHALASHLLGREDLEFPGTYGLLATMSPPPDVVHCHNLHGGYFDLRALSWLSRRVPTLITLHDAWLLSGHCAHAVGCDRWASGCGRCPDLDVYPAVRRDATAFNWARKREIYATSVLYLASPSQWMMEKAARSMLGAPAGRWKVIPNGVDVNVFRPADKRSARRELGLPDHRPCVLTVSGRHDEWADRRTLAAAIDATISKMSPQPVAVVAVGGTTPPLHGQSAHVRWIPYHDDPQRMARYYQAADVYLHCARAATFPNTVLEALACGTPVVACGIGGIPEQIVPGASGWLVPAGDAAALADATTAILADAELALRMGTCAAADARRRFDLDRQVRAYLDWYRAIIGDWNGNAQPATHHNRDAVP